MINALCCYLSAVEMHLNPTSQVLALAQQVDPDLRYMGILKEWIWLRLHIRIMILIPPRN